MKKSSQKTTGERKEERAASRLTPLPMSIFGATAASATSGGGVQVRGGCDSEGGWVGSTKLERLELELREMKKRAGAKAVVFSQARLTGFGRCFASIGQRAEGCKPSFEILGGLCVCVREREKVFFFVGVQNVL